MLHYARHYNFTFATPRHGWALSRYVEVRKAPKKAQIFAAVDSDPMAKALSALYTEHDGDIKAVFEILGENPGKALK